MYSTSTETQLVRKAARLYPLQPLAAREVRHNRREWVKAISFLRTESRAGWVLDKEVPRSAQGGY